VIDTKIGYYVCLNSCLNYVQYLGMFNILFCLLTFCSSPRGTGFLSGHADGTIVRYYVIEDPTMEQQVKLIFLFSKVMLFYTKAKRISKSRLSSVV